jgi:hypothetical protein
MKLKLLKIALRVVGGMLLVLGGFKLGAGVVRSVHMVESSSAASFTLMLPMHWFYVALAGFGLCAVSFLFRRKREHV